MTLPLRPELVEVEPYGAPQLDVPVRLNVNENPYSPSQDVIDEIVAGVERVASGLNRYPDRDALELRQSLSDYLQKESGVNVPKERIWAANGSNEVMLHILQAYGGTGRVMMSFAPTYSMYHEYARDTGTTWIQGNRNEDFSLNMDTIRSFVEEHAPSVLVLTSPNNPTGTALTIEEVREVAELTKGSGPRIMGEPTDTIFVVDEAYGEFRREGVPSALKLLDEYEHLIVTMAGLRLGYLAAGQAVVDDIMKVRLPYHLSATTQAVALAALKHSDELMSQVAHLRETRDDLVEWLKEQGFEVAESDANFVLFGRFENREEIFEELLERGILIRVVGPDGFLRVSVGTDEEDSRFRAALKEILK